MLYTLGVRLQLSQMRLDNANSFIDKKNNIIYGDITTYNIEGLTFSTAGKFVKKIVINDVFYKIGTVIVIDACSNEIEFGKILAIFEDKGEIFFHYNSYEYQCFEEEYFAYEVKLDTNSRKTVNYNTLLYKYAALLTYQNNREFVSLRHSL